MRLFLTTTIIFLFINSTFAQLIKDWNYDNIDAYNYFPTTNIVNDGTFSYVCSQSDVVLKTAYLFKLDNTGGLVDQDSINNFEYSILDNKRMIIDSAGSIYLCGSVYDSTMNTKIRLIKFDSDLNRLWDISFIDSNTLTCNAKGILYSPTENKIYVVGQKYDSTTHTIVVKFDTDGNYIWECADTMTSTFALTSYVIDYSGNVIWGGYAFVPAFGTAEDFLVVKINTSGTFDWINRENGSDNSDDWVFDVCVDKSNNIFASGVFSDTDRLKVFKYDPSGNRLWTKNIPDISLNKVAADPAGNFYVVGYDSVPQHEFIIYKYSANGTLIHTTFSDLPNNTCYSQDYFVSIQVTDSANVYLLHSADSITHLRWLVARLDSSLNIQWITTYPPSTFNPATPSALCFADGGITVSGKIDNFLSVVHFTEPIPDYVQVVNEKEYSFRFDPVMNILFYEIEKLKTKKSDFKILNMQGKIVRKWRDDKNSNTINVEELSPGVYFFIYEIDDNSIYEKFIRL